MKLDEILLHHPWLFKTELAENLKKVYYTPYEKSQKGAKAALVQYSKFRHINQYQYCL